MTARRHDGAPAEPVEGSGDARRRTRRRLVLIAVAVVLLVSAGLRIYNLGSPPEHMFDEVYYAKDARAIIDGRMEGKIGSTWEPGGVVSWPHPDAGKMAIALGILVAGDGPVGWRLPAVVAGLALLACVYPIAVRLGLSRGWAFVALLLASADLLGIAQSRIATLDIFVATWTALCVLFALKYVQRDGAARWLVLTGICGGLAVATKWSGALALVAALVVILLERQVRAFAPERRFGGRPGGRPADAARTGRARTVAWLGFCLVVLPLAVYLASYTAYFANGHTVADFRELHSQMLHFNFNLSAEHSYASIAPTWIVDYRPVWYSFREVADRFYGVVAIGNPLLWWTSVLCLFAAPVLARRRRSATPALAALLVVVLYVPWFATTRTSFLYYLTPVAPFLAILVAAVAAELVDGARRRTATGAAAAAATPSATATVIETGSDPHMAVLAGGELSRAGGEVSRAGDQAGGPAGSAGGAASKAGTCGGAPTAPPLPARIAAVVAAALLAALLWYPLGRLAALLFWELPGRVADGLAWVAAGVGVALAVTVALIALNSRRLRPWVVLLLLGAIVGIAVPFLPIVLDVAISKEDFYRLMWFPSWI